MLAFWQSDQGEGLAGYDSPHVSGGLGDQTVHQQLGRLAGVQSLPVKVGAPIRHRAEGRVKFGAAYPTSQEAAGHGALGQGDDLDYDKEVEEHVTSVPRGDWMEMPRVVRKVVQGDHLRSLLPAICREVRRWNCFRLILGVGVRALEMSYKRLVRAYVV
ncbi:hypothetical protein NDU88_004698 [Pleurodeles waltl]|uniref:Uncharacterized protein n=1 Tax=Pleurodeles waltl TaxID=8319 RepID=A0AAV7RGF7_PLEWA|nr:hypothetical protein NDU88_004698 [Pleurodeles waltl]